MTSPLAKMGCATETGSIDRAARPISAPQMSRPTPSSQVRVPRYFLIVRVVRVSSGSVSTPSFCRPLPIWLTDESRARQTPRYSTLLLSVAEVRWESSAGRAVEVELDIEL